MIRHAFPSLLLLLSASFGYSQTVDFTANVTSGCAPLTVQFQDATVGTVNSWSWDLGKNDGNPSTLQNPSAIYTEPGTYTISLTVNGSVSKTKTAFIQVFAKPSIEWSSQVQGSCSPLPVVFSDQSSTANGVLTEWLWLFGDGGTSTAQSPTHVYENAGDYSVTLSVKNSHGCQTARIKENSVTIPGVRSFFAADKEISCAFPIDIAFTNTSTGAGNLTHQWNFGDGSTSTLANPVHTFNQPGDFEVSLIVHDANQCTGTYRKVIKIANEGGIDFTSDIVKTCIGSPITLTEIPQKNVLSLQWDFGNNQTSSSHNPVITYTSAGVYTITLEALLEGNTCSSVVKKQIEIINDPEPIFNHLQACERKVTFTEASLHTTRVIWDFGDGNTSTVRSPEHQYLLPGTYVVTLTAFNSLDCPIQLTKNIIVVGDPIAAFTPFEKQNCLLPSLSGCAPFTLPLENTSASDLPIQSLWTFSDNTQSTQKNVSKTFNTKGIYEVLLRVTNTLGCTDTTKAKIYVADVSPTTNFTTDKVSVCVGEEIRFTDTSQNSNFSCWNFGDGGSSVTKEARYSYSLPGTYTVTLTAKNDGCSSSLARTNLIEVKDPGTDFTLEKNCTDPYTISLVNTTLNYNSITWDLGDGTNASSESLTHTYALGSYTVKLTATNTATGCVVSKEENIHIQDIKADFVVSNTNVCKGETAQFLDRSEFATQWSWSFSDGTGSIESSPIKEFPQPGIYNARLTVADSDGCTDEIQKVAIVQVINIDGNFSQSATSTCDEMTVTFTDLSTADPPVTQWNWFFGDGKTSSDQHAVNTYDQLGDYTVTLELTNALGVCSIVREQAISFTNPVAGFSTARNQLCAGESILFSNQSQEASQFFWDFGDGRTSSAFMPQINYDAAGLYNITLKVKDNYGCEVTLIKSNFIEIKKPVANFEAFQTSAECPPLIATFLNRSSPDVVQWNWTFGDGQQSTLASPLNTYRLPGIFDVTLQVKDNIGCTSSITQENVVSIGGPNGTLNYSTSVCILDTLTFTASTTNAVVHRWDFADGLVKEGTTTETHIYENEGVFKPILLLIDDKGCQVAIDSGPQIVVHDKPQIDFSTNPASAFTGESISLLGDYELPATITWHWLDFEITQDTIETIFEKAGEVQIRLFAIDQFGCTNEIVKTLIVQQSLDFLPNVFTPNEDGKNDAFIIPAVYDGSWEIRIYNRWGNLVYTNDEYKNDWKGSNVATGVYFFELKNNLRKDHAYKGYVHVIHK